MDTMNEKKRLEREARDLRTALMLERICSQPSETTRIVPGSTKYATVWGPSILPHGEIIANLEKRIASIERLALQLQFAF